jgi:hypothetical protein
MRKFIIGALLLFAMLGCDGPERWPKDKFTAATWQSTPEQGRYRFVQDLLGSNALMGQTRAGVINLLGQPSSATEGGNIAYVVKVGGKGFDQVYILDIRFDNGTVTEALVRGD